MIRWVSPKFLEEHGFKSLEEAVEVARKMFSDTIYETVVGEVMMMYRKPLLPVLVIGKHGLKTSYEYQHLAVTLVATEKTGYLNLLTVIDAKGYEFHFEIDRHILRPDWFGKRWHKKDIIALYNNHCIVKSNQYQPKKKLSSIPITQIMNDLCGMLGTY